MRSHGRGNSNRGGQTNAIVCGRTAPLRLPRQRRSAADYQDDVNRDGLVNAQKRNAENGLLRTRDTPTQLYSKLTQDVNRDNVSETSDSPGRVWRSGSILGQGGQSAERAGNAVHRSWTMVSVHDDGWGTVYKIDERNPNKGSRLGPPDPRRQSNQGKRAAHARILRLLEEELVVANLPAGRVPSRIQPRTNKNGGDSPGQKLVGRGQERIRPGRKKIPYGPGWVAEGKGHRPGNGGGDDGGSAAGVCGAARGSGTSKETVARYVVPKNRDETRAAETWKKGTTINAWKNRRGGGTQFGKRFLESPDEASTCGYGQPRLPILRSARARRGQIC